MFKKYFNSLSTNKKIFVFALCTTFLAQVFTGILACASILKCSYSVGTQVDSIGKIAEESAKIAMQNQSRDILLKTSSQVSDGADLVLTQTENKVENLCNFSESAYLCDCENAGDVTGNQISAYVINDSEHSEEPGKVLTYENNSLPESMEKEFKILNSAANTAVSIYKSSDEIAGVYIVSETGIVYKSHSGNNSEVSDFRLSSWYKRAKESATKGEKSGAWTSYVSSSDDGNSHIIFSKTFFDPNGKIKGVAAIDLYADKVCGKINSFANYDDKDIFIFDNDAGKVISSHSDSNEFLKGFDNPPSESYSSFILSLKNREYGVYNTLFGDEEYLTSCSPIKKINWSVGIVQKSSAVETDSKDIKEKLLGEIENSNKKSGSDTSTIIFQFLIIFCSFGIVMYAFCGSMVKKIFQNIESDENDAKSFRKIKAELEMAEKIQKSMLPEITPSNLKRDDLEIYASSVPAEKVGGDFYDFFFIDEKRLALVIADASDKGVPAALYMSVAKKLLKNKIKSTGSLSLSMESVNDSLYEDNSMRMFVTAFVGVLNIKSGKFEFINAGHTPPLFYNHVKGSFDFLSGPHNCALGGIKGKKYAGGEIFIHKNDTLLLYTDGVTETTNAEKKLFSQQKLKDFVNSEDLKHLSIENFIETIRAEIKKYSGKSDSADDVTLLGFRNLSD